MSQANLFLLLIGKQWVNQHGYALRNSISSRKVLLLYNYRRNQLKPANGDVCTICACSGQLASLPWTSFKSEVGQKIALTCFTHCWEWCHPDFYLPSSFSFTWSSSSLTWGVPWSKQWIRLTSKWIGFCPQITFAFGLYWIFFMLYLCLDWEYILYPTWYSFRCEKLFCFFVFVLTYTYSSVNLFILRWSCVVERMLKFDY